MNAASNFKEALRRKKREFCQKRGRMGRSLFFTNLCIVFVFCLLYTLAVFLVVESLDDVGVPHFIFKNIYHLSVGALYVILALATRGLRVKRLRDMGLPVLADLPFMLLLLSHGLGPFFYFFDVPYLHNLNVVDMPENLRDLLGVVWLIWLLVMVLAPSKRREDLFTCTAELDERVG